MPPTNTPTITVTPTATASATATPKPTIEGFDIPVPILDLENPNSKSTIGQYAKAVNLDPTAVTKEITYKKTKDHDGSSFALALTKDGTPLFIATQDPKSGEWEWRETAWKDEGEKTNLPIGTILDFGDNGSKLPSYKQLGSEQFNFITLSGSVYEKWWKNGGMDYWTSFAHTNNLPVSINPIFFHDDVYNIENPTPDNVRQFMKDRLRKILKYAALPTNDPHHIKISSIVLANEPFVIYKGRVIWQGCGR